MILSPQESEKILSELPKGYQRITQKLLTSQGKHFTTEFIRLVARGVHGNPDVVDALITVRNEWRKELKRQRRRIDA
jgi:hypothetical protein